MIKTVEKPITIVEEKDYPKTNLPEFVLLGRSNVGKSSFINTLLNRKNFAYISSNPGKTQTLNFYLVNDAFYLVDVPGYGYAKVSKRKREAFGKMIETYLSSRTTLQHIFLLIDSRHAPTEHDHLMVGFLKFINVPFSIIMTKADKLSNNQQQKQLGITKREFTLTGDTEIILFSAITKLNKEHIVSKIFNMLEN
ncbi:ribosome biogenesis GTP-binding protein YihA/YsxC [Liberiplasma polymorphum]|uniref:ribosome biogenesis GTP-binding protein YihA/YsxC n=1 Tax=Liberiplasma polymorphum TaxID=3374570 RepID=UPI0037762A7A